VAAVERRGKVLSVGARTPDLIAAGGELVSTAEMGRRIAAAVDAPA
jgi:hypothetical protein